MKEWKKDIEKDKDKKNSQIDSRPLLLLLQIVEVADEILTDEMTDDTKNYNE